MDASWLINRLKNPSLLEKGDERHLRELIASYPYFSAPYLLLAKSLKDQNHPAFDDLLPLISLQAFDRKRLFKLVHEDEAKVSADAEKAMADGKVEVKAEAEIKAEAEVKVENKVQVSELVEETEAEVKSRSLSGEVENEASVSDRVRRSSLAKVQPVEEVEDEVKAETPEPVSRFAVNFEEVEKEEEAEATEHEEIQEIPFLTRAKDEVEAKDKVETKVDVEDEVEIKAELEVEAEEPVSELVEEQEVDAEIKVEAEEPVSEPVEEQEVDVEVKAEIKVEAEQPVSDRVRRSSLAKVRPVEVEKIEIELPKPVTHDPEPLEEPLEEPLPQKTDFLHWLDKLAPISEESGEFEVKASAAAEKAMADKKEEVEEPESLTRDPEPFKEPLPSEQIALIDKFIETNPSVQRVKEKMYDPAVQAKESERLDDSLMTETMARILVKQEKFERAIDAYRKLQLKYPQKSDYFAALIEEINRKRS